MYLCQAHLGLLVGSEIRNVKNIPCHNTNIHVSRDLMILCISLIESDFGSGKIT